GANYTLTLSGNSLSSITPRPLNISNVSVQNKTYDGTLDATLDFVTADLLDGDSIDYDYEALYDSKDVGTGIAVTVTDGEVVLSGGDAGNYTLVLDPDLLDDLSGNITAALL